MFPGTPAIPLRPITLLIGENSSGKTTTLAMLRAANQLASPSTAEIDFNTRPFELGAFEQIARRSEPGVYAHTFSIGFERAIAHHPDRSAKRRRTREAPQKRLRVVGTFQERFGQPWLTSQELIWPDLSIQWALTASETTTIRLQLEGRTWDLQAESPARLRAFGPFYFAELFEDAVRDIDGKANGSALDAEDSRRVQHLQQRLFGLYFAAGARGGAPPVTASAPVRSSPRRTYDPRSSAATPDGSHIPMLLAQLYETDKPVWDRLSDVVRRFGGPSGMLEELRVERKGSKASDPFQLQVTVGGLGQNLIDVGYGVSQVLPVIVDAVLAPTGSTSLLQQPEVRLHPRAQAQLGSFFVDMATQEQKRFVVETHSDHLVDRVRMEVRDNDALSPDDVLLLYFERSGDTASVHPIHIGSDGQLVGVPAGYRDFFLREESRLLGLARARDR